MTRNHVLGTALTLAGLASAAGAQFTTIAQESFDYSPGDNLDMLNGGAGFFNFWVSPFAVDGVVVATPGYDAIGEKATSNVNNEGSYRVLSTEGFESILAPNEQFGGDGSTIWVSFTTVALGDDQYGGLSLFEFVAPGPGEKLFLGCPYQTGEWGIDSFPGSGGPGPQTVAGTDCATVARIVTRIDFMPGDERLQMWIDPPVAHPMTPADLDTMVLDFTFNEIRIQSGEPATTFGGFDFDDILIEAQGLPTTVGTNYCLAVVNSTGNASNISGMGSASLAANNLMLMADNLPQQPGIFIAGPTQAQIPFFNGFLCVDPSGLQRFINVSVPDGQGVVSEQVDYATSATGGLNASAGSSYFYQRWNRDPDAGGGNANFSDGLEVMHTP